MLSRDAQLRVEQDLKRLRHGYTCNVERMNIWAGRLNEGACDEDLRHVGELLVEESLDRHPTEWDGAPGVKPTYDEITDVLRAKVTRLIEHYFERVLMVVAFELESVPLLAAEYNAQLNRMGDLLASQYPLLLEHADYTLMTDFAARPPSMGVAELLEQKIAVRRKRDYAGELFSAVPQTVSPLHRDRVVNPRTAFPKRAIWLKSRLLDMGWSDSDPSQWGGPDRKTVLKILRGESVGNPVLKRLADALSKPRGSIPVKASDIPAE